MINRGARHETCMLPFKVRYCHRKSLKETEILITLINAFDKKKGKRKVQGVPQSQTAALPRHQEEEGTDKYKQAQIEQTYEKH